MQIQWDFCFYQTFPAFNSVNLACFPRNQSHLKVIVSFLMEAHEMEHNRKNERALSVKNECGAPMFFYYFLLMLILTAVFFGMSVDLGYQ
jgi:hypothetical protein